MVVVEEEEEVEEEEKEEEEEEKHRNSISFMDIHVCNNQIFGQTCVPNKSVQI